MINLRVLYIVVYSDITEFYLKEVTIDDMNMIAESVEDGVKINQNISSIRTTFLFKATKSTARLEEQSVADLFIDKVVHVSRERLKFPEQSI